MERGRELAYIEQHYIGEKYSNIIAMFRITIDRF